MDVMDPSKDVHQAPRASPRDGSASRFSQFGELVEILSPTEDGGFAESSVVPGSDSENL